MASAGKTIFWSMIAIIIILVGVIALIIGFGVSGNNSNTVMATTSVGRVGDDGILQCTFTPDIMQNIVILWEKEGVSGIVHLYDKGNDILKDQNTIFKGRTAMFPMQVGTGNASLKLSSVTQADAGTYKCTVTTSAGKADSKMNFRVGAYSVVDVLNNTNTSLLCVSVRWYPQPTVSWFNNTSGANLTELAQTGFQPGLGDEWMVSSELKNIAANSEYSCIIENTLARGMAQAKMTVSGQLLKQSSLQILSAASQLSHHTASHSLLLPLLLYFLTL